LEFHCIGTASTGDDIPASLAVAVALEAYFIRYAVKFLVREVANVVIVGRIVLTGFAEPEPHEDAVPDASDAANKS
jgi:hypothetical protein